MHFQRIRAHAQAAGAWQSIRQSMNQLYQHGSSNNPKDSLNPLFFFEKLHEVPPGDRKHLNSYFS